MKLQKLIPEDWIVGIFSLLIFLGSMTAIGAGIISGKVFFPAPRYGHFVPVDSMKGIFSIIGYLFYITGSLFMLRTLFKKLKQ